MAIINKLDISMYLQLAGKLEGIRGLMAGTIKNKNLSKKNMKNKEQKPVVQPH